MIKNLPTPLHIVRDCMKVTVCNSCNTTIIEGETEHLLCPKCQKEALHLLLNVRQDAEMALNGAWNKSDHGFEMQLALLDKFLTS